MNPKGNRYVYVWKENGVANSGLPFYIGIGTHRKSDVPTQKYYRAYQRHLTTGKKNTFAQNKADSLNGNYNRYVGKETVYDDTTFKSQKELYKSFGMTKQTYRKMTSLGIPLNTYKPLKKKLEYNGIVYDSIKELATYLNIDRHYVSQIANGIKENKKIGEVKWLEK